MSCEGPGEEDEGLLVAGNDEESPALKQDETTAGTTPPGDGEMKWPVSKEEDICNNPRKISLDILRSGKKRLRKDGVIK